MEVSDTEFVRENPHSAISASLLSSLPHEDQKAIVAQLIDGAVYCDSWEAYFDYAKASGVPVDEDVAFEAAQAVGLDPMSTYLWITAANACASDDAKRELFQLALSVPLYERDVLVEAYRAFETALEPAFAFHDAGESAMKAVVGSERWPDRYVEFTLAEEWLEVRQQWMVLFKAMNENLTSGVIPADLQLRRMELAYRQMCVQMSGDDSCWYEYALFQLHTLEDKEGAMETLEAGLRASGDDSFSLNNLLAMIRGEVSDEQAPNHTGIAVVDERVAANVYASAAESGNRKESLKRLRGVGKEAAQEGVQDWKVYSQWHCIESALVKDQKMASKVLENGMICCSTSPTDATLLGNEAIRYHLIQRHEREALGYAEQQVEQASQSHHIGRKRAAWNTLVSTENLLGLSFSKTELRRGEEFPQSEMRTFLERSRVGTYLPCTSEVASWLQFVDDYALEKRQERETPFKDVEPAKSKVLCPALALAHLAMPKEAERVDEGQWKVFIPPPNPAAAAAATAPPGKQDEENLDEVVGSRELRGLWAYRVKRDKQTEARLEREERMRKARASDPDGADGVRAETAMGMLIQKFKAVTLYSNQTERLKTLSVDWIIKQLVSTELNLREVLKVRATSQSQ